MKVIFPTISLVVISVWWIFQLSWYPPFVHLLASNDSPAIDRALLYATRGGSSSEDIYFTATEISHLHDVAHLYKPTSLLLQLSTIFSWVLLLSALLSQLDLRIALRSSARLLLGFLLSIGVCLAVFPLFFDAFHLVLFPQGNWSFPESSMLIQLFPLWFWQRILIVWCVMFGLFAGLFQLLSTVRYPYVR